MKRILTLLFVTALFVSCSNESAEKKEPKKEVDNKVDTTGLKGIIKIAAEMSNNPDSLELYYKMIDQMMIEEESYEGIACYINAFEEKGGDEKQVYKLKVTNEEYNNTPIRAIPFVEKLIELSDNNCEYYNKLGEFSYYYLDINKAKENLTLAQESGCINEENKSFLEALSIEYDDFGWNDNYWTFKYPTEWKTKKEEKSGMYFFEAVHNNGVNFNITKGSDQGSKADVWAKMIKQDHESEGHEILEEGPLSFVHQPHVYFKIRKLVNNKPIIQSNFILIYSSHDLAFMMNYTCPEELLEEYGKYELPIFLSFRRDPN